MEATFSVRGARAGERPALAALLQALRRVAGSLTRPLTLNEIAEVAISGAVMAVDAGIALVSLTAENGRELRRVRDVGLSDAARHRVTSVARDAPGLVARVAYTREPTFVRSLAQAHARSGVFSLIVSSSSASISGLS